MMFDNEIVHTSLDYIGSCRPQFMNKKLAVASAEVALKIAGIVIIYLIIMIPISSWSQHVYDFWDLVIYAPIVLIPSFVALTLICYSLIGKSVELSAQS